MRSQTFGPRILYLGMGGVFSVPALKSLIDGGHNVVALVTPAPPGARTVFRRIRFPASGSVSGANVYELASAHQIPIVEVGVLEDTSALHFLSEARPDLIVAACFSKRLPSSWLQAPRLGCINLHPSMLPLYRGASPLEDQLAAGETTTGISLHFMDGNFDSGDLIAQQALPIPGGATLAELNRQAAEVGAGLLLRVLKDPAHIPHSPPTG